MSGSEGGEGGTQVSTVIRTFRIGRIFRLVKGFESLNQLFRIAHTIKGKGVGFAEDTYRWHSNDVTDAVYAEALSDLGEPS